MINYYKYGQNSIENKETIDESNWIKVTAPNSEEIKIIAAAFYLEIENIMDSLDWNERPRIEGDEDSIYMLIRCPYKQNSSESLQGIDKRRSKFITVPLGIFLKNNKIITISMTDVKIEDTFNQARQSPVNSINSFLFRIFLMISNQYLKYLKEIDSDIDRAEKNLQKSMKNKELIKLLNIEKSLVYFSTSLQSNEITVLERFLKGRILELNEHEEELLEDVIIENKQAIAMAKIYSDILSGMMDAFASVISNNQNRVMKTLTSLTIILNFPTLIASIYGMNFENMPFLSNPYGFWIAIGISALMSLVGTIVFIKRKWL